MFNIDIFNEDYFIYGLILLLALPIIVIIINEVQYKLVKKGVINNAPLNVLKSAIIPLFGVYLLLTNILNIPDSHVAVKLVLTCVWIFVIYTGLSLFNSLIFNYGRRGKKKEGGVPKLLLQLMQIILILIGTAIVLSIVWQHDLGGLVTALGVSSIVIGLALQDTLGNLISGIAILYERPFEINEWIQIQGHVGKVVEINWRATRIVTREGDMIVIPNLTLSKDIFINYNRPVKRFQERIMLRFPLDAEPNYVKETILGSINNIQYLLASPAPEVKIVGIEDYYIKYEVEFYMSEYLIHEEVRDELYTRIWYITRRKGLFTPYPVRNVFNPDEIKSVYQDKYTINYFRNKIPSTFMLNEFGDDELMKQSKIIIFAKGEMMNADNDMESGLYIIVDGQASLEKQGTKSEESSKTVLNVGDVYGEYMILAGQEKSYSIYAQTDVKVAYLNRDLIMKAAQFNGNLYKQIDQLMEARSLITG